MIEEKDPVLDAQAKTRAAINKALAKHGWKLEGVSLRARLNVVYKLERLDGGRQVEHIILLSDVMAWSLRTLPVDTNSPLAKAGLDAECLLLGIALLLRVKQENAADKYTPPAVTT